MDEMITVIVPVYKIKEEFLINCIESLINQGRSDYRIILVDDGSPDNCGAICDEYASKSSIISVIHQKNQGVSVARNNAIKVAKTKWITFVDADDWVECNYIDELYQQLNSGAYNADIVMFEYSREYKSLQSVESLGINTGFLTDEILLTVRKSTFYKLLINGKANPYTTIAIWDKVYKTDFLKSQNIWFVPEARKGQDRLFNADALNSTHSIYYLGKVLYHYRCWEDSRTNRYDIKVPGLTTIELNSLLQIIKKHNMQEQSRNYLNCRICTRLYTCMRLYYFHENNTKPLKSKIEEVKKLVASEPYKSALQNVNMKLLSTQEKIFVMCLKMKLYRMVYVLVKARNIRTKSQLT